MSVTMAPPVISKTISATPAAPFPPKPPKAVVLPIEFPRTQISVTMISPPVISKTISATPAAPFPPKLPKPPKSPPLSQPQHESSLCTISRRNAGVLLSILFAPLAPLFHHLPPASALSFGICTPSFPPVLFSVQLYSFFFTLITDLHFYYVTLCFDHSAGPKDWLKEQKKKSSKFLLAPIDASRNSLNAASLLLTKGESEYEEKDLEEVKNLVKSAARDCVAEERNFFVALQAKTGVEVCTFRLIVKNASSLLDDKDPIKLEAEAKLTDLVRSFASLSDMASESSIQVASNRQRVASALMDTLFSLNNFEKGIKDCLEI